MTPQYKTIADEIAQNIATHKYMNTLPPLRELSKLFNVSLHTIQLALGELSKRALIVSDSTRCVRIIQHPSSKIIGVFCNFRKGNSNDAVVLALRRLIEADGYEAIFVDVPEKVCNEVDGAFWRYGWADGYISLYGTSDTNIDIGLQSFGLPVVTANHAEHKAALSCVDFDHSLLLHELAEGLYERGYRRIALSMTICSHKISDEVNEAFAAFRERHGLPLIGSWITRSHESDIQISREARIAQHFEQMLGGEDKPEAIICFHRGLKFAAALASQYNLELGKDLVLVGTGRNDTPAKGIMPVEFSYQALAAKLWQVLKKHILNKKAQMEIIRIPPPTLDWTDIPIREG